MLCVVNQIRNSAVSRKVLLFVLCLAIGAVTSIALGQDVNWDLRNYHLSTPLGFMRGSLDRNFFVSGIQSYFNPTLDFIYAFLATGPLSNLPRILAGVMGLWYGALIFITFRLASALLSSFPAPKAIALAGVITAVTGAATFSQIGATTNEIALAVLVLWGLLILFPALPPVSREPVGLRAYITAGILFGLAAGLKLTACIYALALCLALFSLFSLKGWVRVCLAFSTGWLFGFMSVFAWWGVILEKRFGSPTFPLFNGIFKSPLYPPENFLDARFFPRNTMEWLFYPFYWATSKSQGRVAELTFHDPRFALAMTSILLFGASRLCLHLRAEKPDLSPPQRLTLSFVIVSYVTWLLTTSILRYAVGIEILSVLTGLFLLPSLAQVLPNEAIRKKAIVALAVLFCVICLGSTRVMNWGHVHFGKNVFDVDMTATQPDTLFVSVTGPSAYLSAFVPEDKHARFVGFSFTTVGAKDWPLAAMSKEIVETHQGPIVVLVPHGMMNFTANLPVIGVSHELGVCRPISSNLDSPFGEPVLACPAQKIRR